MANAFKFLNRPKGNGHGVGLDNIGMFKVTGGKVENVIPTNAGTVPFDNFSSNAYGASKITGAGWFQKANQKIFSEKGQVPGANASSLDTIDAVHSARRGNNKAAREALATEKESIMRGADKITDQDELKKFQGILSGIGKDMNSLRLDSALSYGRQGWDYTKRAGSWAMEGNGWDRAKKVGILAGGATAVNGTGRMLSGGGVTYNNDGERDIMGIPFV